MGLQLGIEDYDHELQNIQLDEVHRTVLYLASYVQCHTCANPNYHDLIKALETAGESQAAQQIRENSSLSS